jgi:hypothetical protein
MPPHIPDAFRAEQDTCAQCVVCFFARFHGKDEEGNLVYFKLSKMKDLFDAHDDGHYYLPIKSVKVRQVFRIA